MSVTWNPWHGCRKISSGCQNCYVYRTDMRHDKDSAQVTKNTDFSLPVRKNRAGEYKVAPGEMVYTCFTSDFFLDIADGWRDEAWSFIRERSDLQFFFITKRILRFEKCVPYDWGNGYDNVTIGCTAENQQMADERLPVFLQLPIKKRIIINEPLLGKINLEKYLTDDIFQVVVGGESGNNARVCDYSWVLDIREQCARAGVSFYFKQTGAAFRRGDRVYRIARKFQHSQARKADINLQIHNSSIL